MASMHELEDDRPRRRDQTCLTTGLLGGAALGLFAGVLGGPGGMILLTAIGVLAGGVIGKLVAGRISVDDWDPPLNRRPYVGTRAPDDDVASAH